MEFYVRLTSEKEINTNDLSEFSKIKKEDYIKSLNPLTLEYSSILKEFIRDIEHYGIFLKYIDLVVKKDNEYKIYKNVKLELSSLDKCSIEIDCNLSEE